MVFLPASGVVWYEVERSRQAGVSCEVSLVGRRVRSQANQSSRRSSQKCMQARVSFSSQRGPHVWLAAFTDCLEALSNSDPHQRKAQNPLLAVKQAILPLVYVEMRYSHVWLLSASKRQTGSVCIVVGESSGRGVE